MRTIKEFKYSNEVDADTLAFNVDGSIMYMKSIDYDIPDKDILFLNTYVENGKIFFIISDEPDETSAIISWRLLSRLIAVALYKKFNLYRRKNIGNCN